MQRGMFRRFMGKTMSRQIITSMARFRTSMVGRFCLVFNWRCLSFQTFVFLSCNSCFAFANFNVFNFCSFHLNSLGAFFSILRRFAESVQGFFATATVFFGLRLAGFSYRFCRTFATLTIFSLRTFLHLRRGGLDLGRSGGKSGFGTICLSNIGFGPIAFASAGLRPGSFVISALGRS